MNTRISDAAVETFDRAYNHAWRESTISFPERTVSYHVREANRAALETVLPHLQPAKPEAVRLRDELRERAAFEAWAKVQTTHGNEHVLTRVGPEDDRYLSPLTSAMWAAWQSALVSVQPSPAGQGDAILRAAVSPPRKFDPVAAEAELSALAARQPVGDR